MAGGSVDGHEDLDQLGARVRARRLSRGWTQAQLAERADVTVPHLSRLESGERLPSLQVLASIATALDVGLAELFDGSSAPNPLAIVRGDARRVPDDGIEVQPLTAVGSTPGLVAARMAISPDREPGDLRSHEGHNWLYVLRGRLRIDTRRGSEVLRPGDCASFLAAVPHRLVAEGGRPAEVLVVGAVRAGRA